MAQGSWLTLNKLSNLWQRVRSSLWFVPAIIVCLSVVLAAGMIQLDILSDRQQLAADWPMLLGADAEGSRGLLTTIAGSMITVAGVTFSITVVALALASSQYTSRILANFMRDTTNQVVLGVFVGVFTYCLVVLRTVRHEGFVPALAIVGAVALALVAIGFLIYFIHHIAASIQAASIIESTARETLAVVDRLYPAERDEEPLVEVDRPEDEAWISVPAASSGYIQDIDLDALLGIARKHDLRIRMVRGVGDFVIEATPIAALAGAAADEDLAAQVNAACTLGRQRTAHQDAAFGVRQIVDIALKALSPGINDTTTAVNCVDYLGVILARLAPRPIAPAGRVEGGRRRVISRGPGFADFVAEAFDQIRQNSASNVAVLVRQLEVLASLATLAVDGSRRATVLQHADWLVAAAERGVAATQDLATIRVARERVIAALKPDDP